MALFPLGILSAAGAGFDSDFELISSTILTTTASSVVFDVSSLASTYRHLQIRVVTRSNNAAASSGLGLRFNGDTASSYNTHGLFGPGTSVVSYNVATTDAGLTGSPAASAASNVFGFNIIDLVDVFSTTKNKTIRVFGHRPGSIELTSGLWRNTAATTSLTVYDQLASLIAGSRLSLYGIRG